MGIQFDWHEGDEEGQKPEKRTTKDSRRFMGGLWIVGAGIIIFALIGTWYAGKKQAETEEAELRSQIDTLFDLEQQAIETGDGDLFLSVQADDPAWLAVQLRPEQIAFSQTDRTVTRATQLDNEVWANVQWQENGETYQRLAFFRLQNGGLKHTGTAENYWANQNIINEFATEWGFLQLPEGDRQWANMIADRITDMITEICESGCSDRALESFTVKVTSHYEISAFNTNVQLPSPRLLGLDEDGFPALPFWNALEAHLTTYLKPAYIRFAVPLDRRVNNSLEYVRLSHLFMAQNPGVVVEIVPPDALPNDPNEWLKLVDGAALPPTQDLITAGLVHDLTPFVQSDPDFDKSDFYDQVWRGAWWQDRMWFMPTSANINLLFYDKVMFEDAGIDYLSIGMTWTDFEDTLAQLQAETATPDMPRVFLDETNDMLYAYAFSWGKGCRVSPCMVALNAGNITPALNWYQQLTTEDEYLIDLSHVPNEDRDLVAARLTSAFREVGVWVDSAVDYEYHLDLSSIGVAPFPVYEAQFTATGAGELPPVGVSPLRLDGHIMSQHTSNAYWTWQWLKFLSYQSPAPRFRNVPARPSVARDTNYWNILIPELREPIQTAFPLARPILIGEEKVFAWERLAEVSNGEVGDATVNENAGNLSTQTGWFGVDP